MSGAPLGCRIRLGYGEIDIVYSFVHVLLLHRSHRSNRKGLLNHVLRLLYLPRRGLVTGDGTDRCGLGKGDVECGLTPTRDVDLCRGVSIGLGPLLSILLSSVELSRDRCLIKGLFWFCISNPFSMLRLPACDVRVDRPKRFSRSSSFSSVELLALILPHYQEREVGGRTPEALPTRKDGQSKQ